MNVYDFDGTIYDGDSTIDFWIFSIKRHPKTVVCIFTSAIGLFLYLFGIINKTRLKERFYKFLNSIPNIEQELFAFWDEHERKIKQWYLMRKKPDDIIVSASPEFLLKPMCDKLDVHLIASKVDKHTGLCTGENCYGNEKMLRLEMAYPGFSIREFYSDSYSDAPLAQIALNAYWVCGDNIIFWNERKTSVTYKIRTTFFTPEFFLFVFCGGIGTLANFFCSLTFSQYINSTFAYVCGYSVSMFVTYALNTLFIFKMPFSFTRFAMFVISYIPNFIILVSFVAILLNVFYFVEIIAYLLTAVFGLPVTFITVKLFAFGEKTGVDKKNG